MNGHTEDINVTGFIDYEIYPEYFPVPIKDHVENKSYLIIYYDLFKLVGSYSCVLDSKEKIDITHTHVLLLSYVANFLPKSEEEHAYGFSQGNGRAANFFM